MSAKKTTSPEAEQHKLWKLELKQQLAAAKKVDRDFTQAERDSRNEYRIADRAFQKACTKREKTRIRLAKKRPAAIKKITTRIAILQGRLGL